MSKDDTESCEQPSCYPPRLPSVNTIPLKDLASLFAQNMMNGRDEKLKDIKTTGILANLIVENRVQAETKREQRIAFAGFQVHLNKRLPENYFFLSPQSSSPFFPLNLDIPKESAL